MLNTREPLIRKNNGQDVNHGYVDLRPQGDGDLKIVVSPLEMITIIRSCNKELFNEKIMYNMELSDYELLIDGTFIKTASKKKRKLKAAVKALEKCFSILLRRKSKKKFWFFLNSQNVDNIVVEWKCKAKLYTYFLKQLIKNDMKQTHSHTIDFDYTKKRNIEKEILGKGGFGVVYKASKNNRQYFAIKKQEIALQTLDSTVLKTSFREMSVLAKLHHPNIVRYYTSWVEIEEQDKNCLSFYSSSVNSSKSLKEIEMNKRLSRLPRLYAYIQTELCLANLEHWLFSIRKIGTIYDFSTEIDMMHNLLSALEYMHSQEVLHRDIKPSNILVIKENNKFMAKVGDFGLSRLIHDVQTEDTKFTSNIGTLIFRAPEAKGSTYSYPSDIYSLGRVFQLMLSKCKTLQDFIERLNNTNNGLLLHSNDLQPDEFTLFSYYVKIMTLPDSKMRRIPPHQLVKKSPSLNLKTIEEDSINTKSELPYSFNRKSVHPCSILSVCSKSLKFSKNHRNAYQEVVGKTRKEKRIFASELLQNLYEFSYRNFQKCLAEGFPWDSVFDNSKLDKKKQALINQLVVSEQIKPFKKNFFKGSFTISAIVHQSKTRLVAKVQKNLDKGIFIVDAKKIKFVDISKRNYLQTIKNVYSLLQFKHSNVLRYFQIWLESSPRTKEPILQIYVQMEYICLNLENWLEDKKNEDIERELFDDIVSGLNYVYKHFKVHGNIRTTNIFISTNDFRQIAKIGQISILPYMSSLDKFQDLTDLKSIGKSLLDSFEKKCIDHCMVSVHRRHSSYPFEKKSINHYMVSEFREFRLKISRATLNEAENKIVF
ncbi:DgyrCDS657 [Dimorphilus gyrociliatus]|uniref:non-specific serine/threonine protein kinase n=2 Tax=Dimorphilus gyrociliatus TaxID=2664684 RepID=A0A7I8V750_9ANNE|nr:DgyrCDS657 [Dimorphilus gyrociliatus]